MRDHLKRVHNTNLALEREIKRVLDRVFLDLDAGRDFISRFDLGFGQESGDSAMSGLGSSCKGRGHGDS
jgi:hypothetical protein